MWLLTWYSIYGHITANTSEVHAGSLQDLGSWSNYFRESVMSWSRIKFDERSLVDSGAEAWKSLLDYCTIINSGIFERHMRETILSVWHTDWDMLMGDCATYKLRLCSMSFYLSHCRSMALCSVVCFQWVKLTSRMCHLTNTWPLKIKVNMTDYIHETYQKKLTDCLKSSFLQFSNAVRTSCFLQVFSPLFWWAYNSHSGFPTRRFTSCFGARKCILWWYRPYILFKGLAYKKFHYFYRQ
jgi:hypothetical protein